MSTNHDSNEARFEELLRRNRRRISAIARTYAQQQSDDLLQQILMQIWRGLPRLREQTYSDTWCYRVALNTAISWARAADRQAKYATPLNTDQLAGTDDGHDAIQLLQRFLQTLKATDRAIVLMYLEDLSSSQMAEVLGMTEGAIRVRLHRIKQKLTDWSAIDS